MKKERTGWRLLRTPDSKSCQLGLISLRFMIDGDDSSGRFSLVEHPMEPRALAAPGIGIGANTEYAFAGNFMADLALIWVEKLFLAMEAT